MSRMLSYVAREPLSMAAAVGDDLLAQFAALSRLHADGWGTAWRDAATGAVLTAGAATPLDGPDEWAAALSAPSTARMVYLRFASRGAPPAPENVQPFRRDDAAFQHNGLVSPREDALALLGHEQRAELRGTTDSEVYFAVVRTSGHGVGAFGDPSGIARGVARLRAHFPAACLNAMLLTESGLRVVHAAGTARVPLAAFVDRGADVAALPPGHDDDYNTLRTTASPSGARIVATTGIDQEGWTRLADESVFVVTEDGVAGVRV